MTIHDPKLDPKLDRRKLLAATGLGAASLFLPSLARRGAAQSAPPKRLVIMFSLHGTNYPNWRMRRTGLDENTAWEFPFDDADPNSFSEVLRPLHGVRQNLLVLDGIAQVSAIGDVLFNNHPKGRIHALTAAPFTRLNGEVATSTQASFDQVMAQRIRRADRLPSLELMGIGNDAFVYSGAGAAVPFEASPRAAFDRLFPGTSTPSPVSNAERIRGAQASVLDFVQGEFDVVKRRLSTEDQQKLDLHRDYIRDLELRLGNLSTVTCERPERPGNISTSDYQGRFDAFVRVAGAALACDLTRVVTFGMPQLSNAQAGAPPGDIHTDYAHHEADNPTAATVMTNYHRVHAEHFRTLVDTLARIPEGNGTVLDNTVCMWVNELATGNHKFERWPVVLAGGTGTGLRFGRYVRWPATIPTPNPNPTWGGVEPLVGPPHNKLFVSVARALGVDMAQIGSASIRTVAGVNIDLTGPLDRLT